MARAIKVGSCLKLGAFPDSKTSVLLIRCRSSYFLRTFQTSSLALAEHKLQCQVAAHNSDKTKMLDGVVTAPWYGLCLYFFRYGYLHVYSSALPLVFVVLPGLWAPVVSPLAHAAMHLLEGAPMTKISLSRCTAVSPQIHCDVAPVYMAHILYF